MESLFAYDGLGWKGVGGPTLIALVEGPPLHAASELLVESTSEPDLERSPFEVVAALAPRSRSFSRLLDAAMTFGLDWTAQALGAAPVEGGAVVNALGAVGVLGEALECCSSELDALLAGAALIPDDHGSYTTDEFVDRADAAAGELNDLLCGVSARMVYGQLAWVGTPLGLAAVDLVASVTGRGERVQWCYLCHAPFLVNRSDSVFCSRPLIDNDELSPERTCRSVGPSRKFAATVGALDAAYRRRYKRLDNWRRRGHITSEDLDQWRTGARALLETAKSEQWPPAQYEHELAAIEPERSTR